MNSILRFFNYAILTALVMYGGYLWMMSWTGCGRKQSWPILVHNASTYLE